MSPTLRSGRNLTQEYPTISSNLTPSVNIQKTPFNKGVLSLHTVKKSGKNADTLKVLEKLLKKSWTIYSVTPLFSWSGKESKLKKFSRQIAEILAKSLPSIEGDYFEVDYEVLPTMKLFRSDDVAIKITVNVINHEDKKKQVFVGYLLSWGCPQSAKIAELDGVVHLPVFLCSGSRRVGAMVCRSLEIIHDCVAAAIRLSEGDRKELWFALLSYLRLEDETITLTYSIPSRPELGCLELEISSDIPTQLSKLINKRSGRDTCTEDNTCFWEEINCFAAKTYGIKLQCCEMKELRMSQASLAAEKFKTITVKAMHVILIFLTNVSVMLESNTARAE